MGIAQKHGLDYLLNQCNILDNTTRYAMMKSSKKISQMRVIAGDIKSTKNIIAVWMLDRDFLKKQLNTLTKIPLRSSKRQTSKIAENYCSFEACQFMEPSEERTSCDTCGEMFHWNCIGMWTTDSQENMESQTCFSCRRMTISEVKQLVETEINEITRNITTKEKLLGDLLKEQEEYDSIFTKSNGPTRKKLEEDWKSLGSDMNAWQQNFTGNHVRLLLKQQAVEKYTRPFREMPGMTSLKIAAQCLGTLQTFSKATCLTKEEMVEMDINIKKLFQSLQQLRFNRILRAILVHNNISDNYN